VAPFCTVDTGRTQDRTWHFEQAIPFKQLRFPRSDQQISGLNIRRLIRHRNDNTFWSHIPRQFGPTKTTFSGYLDGIGNVRPGRNIRVKPFVTGSLTHANDANRGSGDGGLDVKIGLGTNLVLDGTDRTDVSQVEADARQVNLTRFSLFLPEKRVFPLENQGGVPDRWLDAVADEAQDRLFDYIEVFYNQRRRHSSAGRMSPVTFEREMAYAA
jgi:transposase InsO family protein